MKNQFSLPREMPNIRGNTFIEDNYLWKNANNLLLFQYDFTHVKSDCNDRCDSRNHFEMSLQRS